MKYFRKNHHQKAPKFQNSRYNENLDAEYAKIGRIVERVNFVELKINQIITEFYISPDKQSAFLEDFMFAGRLRLNDKIRIFRTILKRKNIMFDESAFEKWIQIRNMVAHGIPRKDSNSPRATLHFNGNIYDIESEFRDFEKLHAKILAIIEKLNHENF